MSETNGILESLCIDDLYGTLQAPCRRGEGDLPTFHKCSRNATIQIIARVAMPLDVIRAGPSLGGKAILNGTRLYDVSGISRFKLRGGRGRLEGIRVMHEFPHICVKASPKRGKSLG